MNLGNFPVLKTPGKAAKILLTADCIRIKNSRNDLAYVTVEIVDANGALVSADSVPLKFSITDNGEIVATASANPNDMQSFQKPKHRTFRGKCLIIVKPRGRRGEIIVKANGPGLTEGQAIIRVN